MYRRQGALSLAHPATTIRPVLLVFPSLSATAVSSTLTTGPSYRALRGPLKSARLTAAPRPSHRALSRPRLLLGRQTLCMYKRKTHCACRMRARARPTMHARAHHAPRDPLARDPLHGVPQTSSTVSHTACRDTADNHPAVQNTANNPALGLGSRSSVQSGARGQCIIGRVQLFFSSSARLAAASPLVLSLIHI